MLARTHAIAVRASRSDPILGARGSTAHAAAVRLASAGVSVGMHCRASVSAMEACAQPLTSPQHYYIASLRTRVAAELWRRFVSKLPTDRVCGIAVRAHCQLHSARDQGGRKQRSSAHMGCRSPPLGEALTHGLHSRLHRIIAHWAARRHSVPKLLGAVSEARNWRGFRAVVQIPRQDLVSDSGTTSLDFWTRSHRESQNCNGKTKKNEPIPWSRFCTKHWFRN